MMRFIFTAFFCLLISSLFSQNEERCGSTIQAHQNMMENNPEYKKHIERWRKAIIPIIEKRRLQKNPDCSAGPILVPVAVHFDNNLVPASQEACVIDVVVDQINEVNAEFAGMDDDAFMINDFTSCFGADILGDACLEFCLATSGHPSGSGLVEGEYAVTFGTVSFNIPSGNYTPVNADWSDYVNIYVDNLANGLLGVSNGIPGNFNGDGVMIDNCVFGTGSLSCSGVQLTGSAGCYTTYDEGETLAHELGHYFGLYHIWGDNSGCGGMQDGIADTPNMSSNYSGYLACGNHNSCSDLPQTCGSEDMYMNFMSYAGDACMYMFTSDQMDVCNATAVTEGFTTSSPKCLSPPVADFLPFGGVSLCSNLCIDFTDESTNSPTIWDWKFVVTSGNINLDIISSTDQNPTVCVTSGNSGTIDVTLTAENSAGEHDTTKQVMVTVITPPTWYQDFDNDSYGNPFMSQAACTQPAGYVSNNGDCDDNDANNFPGNTEVCDGSDNNCDGLIDDDDPNVIAPTWYRDMDADGFGDETVTLVQCDQPLGYVDNDQDCDDNDDNNFPGNIEICDFQDNDCDGLIDDQDNDVDGTPYFEDADGDGFGNINVQIDACDPPSGYVLDNTDCDDTDNTVYPDAPELCDGQINNCNSSTLSPSEEDNDGDGYVECVIDAGGWDGLPSVVGGEDCDDNESTRYPGAAELCDGIINDCNTTVLADNEIDNDGDGYVECSIDVGGWDGTPSVIGGDDCDDSESTKYPGALELCDGIINDCNTASLPGNETDDDSDGYVECSIDGGGWDGAPSVIGGNDCDDTKDYVYPGAPELCDGIINNCHTGTLGDDEIDDDGDGYVECTFAAMEWEGDINVVGGDDCDDGDSNNFPGNTEICDGFDNDCDGTVDEGCMMAPCDDDSLFISTITQDEYHAIDYIWSDAIIMDPDSILYTAGIDIDLVSDFEVELGAVFEARIETCTILFRIEDEHTDHDANLSSQLSQMSDRFYGHDDSIQQFEIINTDNESSGDLLISKDNFGITILQYLSGKESGVYYIKLMEDGQNYIIERLVWIK